jgi:hypothetical protein
MVSNVPLQVGGTPNEIYRRLHFGHFQIEESEASSEPEHRPF